MSGESGIRLGLRANWRQFLVLVVVNAFVGSMVGLERAVLPLLAEQEFGIVSRSAILSFIVAFGAAKASTNLAAGWLSDRIGRKGVLITGWTVGLPVPLLIMVAPSWEWVIFANVLLGVNQGLCWSTTVIMKIDLAGPERRGLAMGLNEAAGYGAVSLAALASGLVAATFALRPYPFLIGAGLAAAGLAISARFVQETRPHARLETSLLKGSAGGRRATPGYGAILLLTTWRDRALSAVSQAGFVNNLNDGIAWGLLPLIFSGSGLPLDQVALLAAIYPGVWGIAQLGTGAISDRTGRRPPIVLGMWLQALALMAVVFATGFGPWAAAMALLGLGTALVYPTLLAAVSDVAHPDWRASAVGVYRLWRDGGYVAGALLGGVAADRLGAPWAIAGVAALTFASGAWVLGRMGETLPRRGAGPQLPAHGAQPVTVAPGGSPGWHWLR